MPLLEQANSRIKEVADKADASIKEVMDKADVSIKDRIERTSIFESYVSIADAFSRLIHPIWELYERDYQKCLRQECQPDSFIRDVRLARLFARRGLMILRGKEVHDQIDKHIRFTLDY
jgi:hypothetical protein